MRWPWWFSGAIALLLISAVTLLPLAAMLREAGSINWSAVLGNTYLQRVIRFSVFQATLSTLLALATAIPVALALSHKPVFPGRSTVIAVFSLSLVIPTIVAIYGIVAVYGRSGWLNDILSLLAIPPMGLYGLPGILIAHVFFNMPLAARILLTSLDTIPDDNWRLSKQLGMSPWAIFRYVEWYRLRSQLPGLALLIFTLCFTSFAIVMTLGGGPRSTTIEVAIYQALRFEFDITLAVALASIQLLICLCLMALSTLVKQDSSMGFHAYTAIHNYKSDPHEYTVKQGLWRGAIWETSPLECDSCGQHLRHAAATCADVVRIQRQDSQRHYRLVHSASLEQHHHCLTGGSEPVGVSGALPADEHSPYAYQTET